ncbi:TRAP transporter large permease subunit [Microvirga sp. 2TAF3]|uniref:TRAP transporter large permease subunit n=1 Tax=Microvirga sp. 2TAF3 TaxID=3233014 RepID=UPI003F9C944C
MFAIAVRSPHQPETRAIASPGRPEAGEILLRVLRAGIDPIHFATFAMFDLMIGLTTPPVSVRLFVAAKISLGAISRATWPFLVCNILFLVSYAPGISLWLPSLFYK